MNALVYCCTCGKQIDGYHAVYAKMQHDSFGWPISYCNHCTAVGLTVTIRPNQLSTRLIALERVAAAEQAATTADSPVVSCGSMFNKFS